MNLTTPEAFFDSLFSNIRGKAGEPGYDDQRPAMMAGLLALDPKKVVLLSDYEVETLFEHPAKLAGTLKIEPAKIMLMEANDVAAIFSAHLYGNVHSGVINEMIDDDCDNLEEDELNTRLEGLIQSGRVSLTVDPQRKDLVAYFDHLKTVPGGLAFQARIAIHLNHGRRSKRAAVHMLKES